MDLNVTPALVNPLDRNISNFSAPQSIGISSYGLSNRSGKLTPYQIKTDEVEGAANIVSINAYNSSPPANVSAYGASVQLNVNLEVISRSGAEYTYWLQDVMDLDTRNQTYFLTDNIWNNTSPSGNVTNGTVNGEGTAIVSNTNNTGSPPLNTSFYVAAGNYTNYTLPLYFYPVIKVRTVSGKPVVSFGNVNASGTHYFDNVTFAIPDRDAYLLVTPYYETPSNSTYDSEFVLGGESSGELAQFSDTSAYLQMYYDRNGTMVSFPSFYIFGAGTAESAGGITTVQDGNLAHVTGGSPDFNSIIYAFNQTTIIAPPSTVSTSSTVPQQQANATTVPGQKGSGLFGSYVVEVVAIVVLILAIIGIYTERRKRKQRDNSTGLETGKPK
jgi:thermopsin